MTKLIADVFDVILRDTATGDVVGTTTLTDAQIQAQVQENDVRAGKGNQLIATLHAQRDITIQLTDAEFKYDWLAKQLGQDVVTGAGVAYAMPKWYTVATASITLDNTPNATDNALAIYNSAGKRITGFTVTTDSVDFTAATPTVADGESVEVRTYKYDTDATTESISFDGSVFAKGVECVLETWEIDENEVTTHLIQYQFTNAIPDGNFTFNTQSQKQAVTQQMNLKVVKPSNSNVVGQSLRIPVVAS
jgi:hypothetical protein